MSACYFNFRPLQQKLELGETDFLFDLPVGGRTKLALLQTFGPNAPTAVIPVPCFEVIATAIDEHKQAAVERVFF